MCEDTFCWIWITQWMNYGLIKVLGHSDSLLLVLRAMLAWFVPPTHPWFASVLSLLREFNKHGLTLKLVLFYRQPFYFSLEVIYITVTCAAYILWCKCMQNFIMIHSCVVYKLHYSLLVLWDFVFEMYLAHFWLIFILFYFWVDTSMCPGDLSRKRVEPEVYGGPIPARVVAGAG